MVCIIEETLSDQAARNCGLFGIKLGYFVCCQGNVGAKIFVQDDRVAVLEISLLQVLAIQLGEAARSHVATVVLVEVVQLIVNVDWTWDVLWDSQSLGALDDISGARDIVVFQLVLHDLITHDVQDDAKAQENDTEDGESDHSGAERGDWSPSWQGLLLEPRVLKLLNLLTDAKLFFFCYIHTCFVGPFRL